MGLAVILATLLIPGALGCSGDDVPDDEITTTATSVDADTTDTTSGDSGSNGTTDAGVGPGATVLDYEAVLPDLTRKAEASPTDPSVLQDLAIAQYQTSRYEEAAATYAAMLKVEDTAITHNNLANVLRDWGKIEEARAEYEKALSMDPGLSVVYMNLASLSLREGDRAGALEILGRGIARTSGSDRERLEGFKATVEAQPAS
jgi:tetratricopeptide (TPR) repeat protein